VRNEKKYKQKRYKLNMDSWWKKEKRERKREKREKKSREKKSRQLFAALIDGGVI